jgi:D-arabinose 1-dehydrogenase-like Zn-dependent alcohol dehydrogenase
MPDFCARHRIEPVTETFPLSRINEALATSRPVRRATTSCSRTIRAKESQ